MGNTSHPPSSWQAALVALVAFAAGLMITGGALAAPPTKPPRTAPPSKPPRDKEGARLRAEGNAAADAGRLAEALAAWRKAWPHRPYDSSLACDIGSTELRVGNDVAAAEWLTRCARLVPPIIDPRTTERRRSESMDLLVAERRVLTLEVTAEPGASIALDGTVVGTAPLAEPLFASPDKAHQLEARKGDRTAVATVQGKAGTRHTITLVLPAEKPKLKPKVPFPQPRPAEATPSFVWWPAALGGALAVGAATVGAVMKIEANDAKAQADSMLRAVIQENGWHCSQFEHESRCSQIAELDAKHAVLTNAATAVFIGTGVIAAGTLGYVAFEVNRVRIKPVVGGVVGTVTW
jgi:hypothetical protein